MSERDPVRRCRFCGYLYYIWKLPVHEAVCTPGRRKMLVAGVVRYSVSYRSSTMRRILTDKEARLLRLLRSGPTRFTDLLRTGVYGRKGLSLALAGFRAEGLAESDGHKGYMLTEGGRKQALRERVVDALDHLAEDSAYDEFEKRAGRLLLMIESRGCVS